MSIGVVGLGYVGLPLVVAFAEAGERVVAGDESKVEAIRAGAPYIEDVATERLRRAPSSIDVSPHYGALARTGDAAATNEPRGCSPEGGDGWPQSPSLSRQPGSRSRSIVIAICRAANRDEKGEDADSSDARSEPGAVGMQARAEVGKRPAKTTRRPR